MLSTSIQEFVLRNVLKIAVESNSKITLTLVVFKDIIKISKVLSTGHSINLEGYEQALNFCTSIVQVMKMQPGQRVYLLDDT